MMATATLHTWRVRPRSTPVRRPQDGCAKCVNHRTRVEPDGSYPRCGQANAATSETTGDSLVPLIANFCALTQGLYVERALHFMLDAAKERGVGYPHS
jgi:hypothetical protein